MEVGVRDLRNRTSQVVDAVKAGVPVTLTYRGSRSPISCRIGAASAGCRGASAR
ncbi:type II toxin-antitoxin system prevent-host-death family antitoxin [Mycobacterium tuberculosis]|uniref:type II toxin-antitoxin system prevent-host-death family antitoxin n=1 Tax=Mycobacterium tuberculosis TaxID=1773 RepID=UPI001F444E6B|nr:type II toxin-antitoxin system prevent-host-death family antitoxin [Mycobacterium tuberculosis]